MSMAHDGPLADIHRQLTTSMLTLLYRAEGLDGLAAAELAEVNRLLAAAADRLDAALRRPGPLLSPLRPSTPELAVA